MLTRKDLELERKYNEDYTEFCRDRECGEGCPVYDAHQVDKTTGCFLIYCRMRESGKLKKGKQ